MMRRKVINLSAYQYGIRDELLLLMSFFLTNFNMYTHVKVHKSRIHIIVQVTFYSLERMQIPHMIYVFYIPVTKKSRHLNGEQHCSHKGKRSNDLIT